ncbi:MAG: DUF7033 domain-containing protein, partial [Chitinophagales bacterium]
MLLICIPQITPRIRYTMQLFFGELIKTEFEITQDTAKFQSFSGAKFHYAKQRIADEVFIYSENLLFEEGIRRQKISVDEYRGMKAFFAHREPSDLPFDLFAVAFYFVSRYEEYLPFTADQYGRFPDEENLLVKEKVHEIPLVNYYAIWLKELLQQKFPPLQFQTSPYQFQLTYDIDFAFAYRGKGMLRNAAGYAKSFLKMDWNETARRTNVLFGNEKDPFDTFDFQFSLHEKFNLQPVYFFLLGDFGKFDRNISWKNHHLQSLIKRISEKNEVGIHSSFASYDRPEKIKTETARLEKISGKKNFSNRQHFLKLKFPKTYQTLLINGINEDYTLGFASQVGFRAGIASPFYWYDLSREEITKLRIYPFAVMDATLYY